MLSVVFSTAPATTGIRPADGFKQLRDGQFFMLGYGFKGEAIHLGFRQAPGPVSDLRRCAYLNPAS